MRWTAEVVEMVGKVGVGGAPSLNVKPQHDVCARSQRLPHLGHSARRRLAAARRAAGKQRESVRVLQ